MNGKKTEREKEDYINTDKYWRRWLNEVMDKHCEADSEDVYRAKGK